MARLQLRDLRELSVMVVHASDGDGAVVREQLRRIGCRVEAAWPPPRALPAHVDVAFVAISHDHHAALKRMLKRAEGSELAVIALVDYENPAMLQLVLDIEAVAVVSKPVRAFGLLTNLVVARNAALEQRVLKERIKRLEGRISGQKKIAKAKSILMETQGISEKAAYRTIQSQAMSKRCSIEEMAVAIINANDLLSSRVNDA